jgi:hypothetical protein
MFAWRSADKEFANFTGRELAASRSHEVSVGHVITISTSVPQFIAILVQAMDNMQKSRSGLSLKRLAVHHDKA